MITRKHVASAIRMIEKIRRAGLNDTYPVDKLDRYENKLNKWLNEFNNNSKVYNRNLIAKLIL